MKQIYYRGSLKCCNYSCSYCPFSKSKSSKLQLLKDREELAQFVRRMRQETFYGAIQIVPYGEALVYGYYWDAMAKLSRLDGVQAVGAQSNFSFPVEKMLRIYEKCGGRKEKLRLWGTFHPEMTTVQQFLEQCEKLQKAGISFCVGAVGVPENLDLLVELRAGLDESVYLWINKMDGLGRNYTRNEIQAFLELDDYFELELKHFRADAAACGDSVFIEGNGSVRPCNLCHGEMGNLYQDGFGKLGRKVCTRRACDCFLSYGNREDMGELLFFRPYPAFRIPAYKQAVFFDVDGTLVPEGRREIPAEYAEKLCRLARHSQIFLATSLPFEAAMGKVRSVAPIIAGGVFANGAGIRIGDWEWIAPVDISWVSGFEEMQKEYGIGIKMYRRGHNVYKVTLTFQRKEMEWKEQWEEKLSGIGCEVVWEGNRMQVTAAGTGKLYGIEMICEKMGLSLEDIAVFGNDENDIEMLSAVPFSVAAPGSSEQVLRAAHIQMGTVQNIR